MTRESRPPLARECFDFAPDLLWVMHCSEGPVPKAAAAAVRDFLEKETKPWLVDWEFDFLGLPNRVRREIARLLAADSSDVSLVQTTSAGLGLIARTYPWRVGDEIVVPLGEFPSNVWPWKALVSRGVRLREIALWDGHEAGDAAWDSAAPTARIDPEERLIAAIGTRTRVLAVSHVRFQDGMRLDLGRLAEGCRRRGVDLIVDGCQAAGTTPMKFEGLAAYCSGGHKGMLCPQGLAALVTSDDLREKAAPGGSWLSVEDAVNFERPSTDHARSWLTDGRRFEQGVPNLLGCAAMEASLKMINEAGVEAIAAWIDELAAVLLSDLAVSSRWSAEAERLSGLRSADRGSSIIALRGNKQDLIKIADEGRERKIYSSIREGYLRIAFHGWHTLADVQRVSAWLNSC